MRVFGLRCGFGIRARGNVGLNGLPLNSRGMGLRAVAYYTFVYVRDHMGMLLPVIPTALATPTPCSVFRVERNLGLHALGLSVYVGTDVFRA